MAQPPEPTLAELVAEVGKVVGEDTVAALGVVLVQFPQHCDQMLLLDLAR